MFNTLRSISGGFGSGRRYSGRIAVPTSIPNNTYWFSSYDNSVAEFGSVLANDATVSTWKDKSGASHDLNKAGAASGKPVFKTNVQKGKGAVYFDGVNDSLNANPITFMQSQTQFTLFVVAKNGILSSGAAITTTDTDGYRIFYNGTNWAVSSASGIGTSTATPDGNMHIFTLVYDGSQTGNSNRLKFRIDKVNQTLNYGATTVGTSTSASAAYFYAGQNSAGTAYFTGYIAEIILYTRALIPSELESTENYFIERWI